MKSFFKYLLASILGVLISSVLIFFLFIGIISAMISGEQAPFTAKPNSILHLKLSDPISDRAPENPFGSFDAPVIGNLKRLGLNDILANIKKASDDDNIKGIYLDLSVIPTGIATITEIRNALKSFSDSGKFIVSSADVYLQNTYYLASVADSVYMTPTGNLAFKGMSAQLIFFKKALDKLELNPEIIRHGKFKSAVEPFMREDMSDANRKQIMTYMGSIWDYLLEGISEERKIPVDKLNELADNLTIRNDKLARQYGFIDGIKYHDQVMEVLQKMSGVNSVKDLHLVKLSDYKKAVQKTPFKGIPGDKIAVVYASGDIVMGEGGDGTMGSEKISQALRDARKDSSVKAIVFRVNSGGGSALASEIIWREAKLASEVKPVYASMGDVAASGGYYILSAADTIIASPNTITGSIGVFGLLMNGNKFMSDKLGITSDVAVTNKHADLGSFFRPLTSYEREVLQMGVEETYDDFITHVAEGRNMTKASVDSIGQGRVWSGANASQIGLVDMYGGLEDAIALAAKRTHLENFRVVSLPKQVDPFQKLMKELSNQSSVFFLKKELGENYKYYESLQNALQMKGIQARMPYDLYIE